MKTAVGWFVLLQMCTAPSRPRHRLPEGDSSCVPAAASEKGLKYIDVVGEKHEGFKHTSMKI